MMITREFGFDMGHMLPDHLGGCYRPHGHRYRLDVTVDDVVQTEGAARGMVLDFAEVKRIVHEVVIDPLDHRFAVCADDPRLAGMRATFGPTDLIVLPCPPTAENLAGLIGTWLSNHLPLFGVRLWETPTCSATWVAEVDS